MTSQNPHRSAPSHPSSGVNAAHAHSGPAPTQSAAEPGAENPPVILASEVDSDLLPLLHDIVRTLEKENQDVTQKNRDSLEASQKVVALTKKIESMRTDIYGLAGIEKSPKEQLDHLEILRHQLQMKRNLVSKYKELNLKVFGLAGTY